MNRRAIGLGLGIAFCFYGSSALAQIAIIGMSVDNPQQNACGVILTPGIHSLTIRLYATTAPVKTAKFKIVSSCPVAWYGTPPNQEYNLTFPTCVNVGDQIENFGIEVFGSAQLCTLRVEPATGSSGIEMTDCAGGPMMGVSSCDVILPVRSSTWGSVKAMYKN